MTAAESLETTFSAVFIELRKALNQAYSDAGLETSPPQAHVMMIIDDVPGISGKDLAQRTGKDKALITRTLAPLLEAGWLERETSPDDARCQQLKLTTVGRSVVRNIRKARQKAHQNVFSALSNNEKKQLNDLFQKCLP